MLFETGEATGTKAEFAARVGRWLAGSQAIVDEAGEEWSFMRGRKLEVDEGGRRYLRIFYRSDNGGRPSRSVFAFLDTTNGDVLRPEGWKRPAAKARGNLFDAAGGLSRVTACGPR
jgi:hypothetical protein